MFNGLSERDPCRTTSRRLRYRVMKSRRRPGEIRDAIIDALANLDRQASVAEIQGAVVRSMDCIVPASSIRSYLRLNTGSLFERTGRGEYQLPRNGDAQRERGEAPLVFEWGRSKLYAGDCMAWLRARPERSIHAVVTDPPYGLVEYSEREQSKLRRGRGGVWRIPPNFDGHRRSPLPRFTTLSQAEISDLRRFFREWAFAILPVLVPGGHVVIASNPLLSYAVSDELVGAGFERRGEIIRLVMTMRGGDRPKNAHKEFADVSVMPRSMWEPWLLFRKPIEGRVQDNLRRWKTGGLRRVSPERPFCDVIRSAPTHKRERAIAPHPSLKPQAFLREIARAVLPLGEGTVLDPFAGSGSTLAACESVGYSSIGIERDETYCGIAKAAIPRLARYIPQGSVR